MEDETMSVRARSLPRGWYPADRKTCEREIQSFLAGWSPPSTASGAGHGGIVPHAGWFFSGKLAAKVFHTLKSNEKTDVVVLYGGHLGPNDFPMIVLEDRCETPLGDVEMDRAFAEKLMKRVDAKREAPSSGDNTIEVQLAMIKYFFPEARVIAVRSPLSLAAVGLGKEVADLAREEGKSILAIGSTDLTHYGPNYGFVPKGLGAASVEWVKKENDKRFIGEALRMNAEGLLRHAVENDSACSPGAVASAVTTCSVLGAEHGVLVDYYTSYDILPDASFVGYAGIVY
jgi:AmmeMemoRadiSam system protein B